MLIVCDVFYSKLVNPYTPALDYFLRPDLGQLQVHSVSKIDNKSSIDQS